MLGKSKVIKKYNNLPVQVKAGLWFLICSFLQRGISTVTTPIFTRLLTTSEYGQYNVFNSWLSIITIIVTLNLYSGVYTQGLVKFEDKKNIFSSSLQGLNGMLCFLWTLLYLAFHKTWNSLFDLTTVQMLCMLVMIWATACFNFWAADQRVEYKYKKLVILTLVVSLAKPIIGIVFVIYSQDKVTARILGLALVELIGYSFLFLVQMKKGQVFYSKKFWLYSLSFNLPLIPHYLSQTILNSSDRIMIKSMVGAEEAGIYGLAYSISQIMILFNVAMGQTISPWIYQKIKKKEINDIASVAYLALSLVAIVNTILIAFAPEVVRLFAPSSYYDAIWTIPPVAMSVLFLFSYDLFAKFEFYYEKTKYIMFASMGGAILNIVLNIVFIRKYGYIAAAYTTLLCYIIYAMAHFWFMNSVCDTYLNGIRPYSIKSLLAIYIAFISCGFILLTTYTNPTIRYSTIAMAMLVLVIQRKRVLNVLHRLINLKHESSSSLNK